MQIEWTQGSLSADLLKHMKQHLNEVRAAREIVHMAYTNIMSIDIPIMVETCLLYTSDAADE